MHEKQRVLQERYKDFLTIANTEDKNTNTDCVGMSDGQTIEEAVAVAKEFGNRSTN
jgi:predicted lactoylglutathione lyase